MRPRGVAAAVAVAALVLAGCHGGCNHSKSGSSDLQWYRARLQADDATVVFFLALPLRGAHAGALIANGKERLQVAHHWKGDVVTVEFPIFGSSITATRTKDGKLEGRYESNRLIGATDTFVAEPIDGPEGTLRFPGDEPPATDISGTWRFEFEIYGLGKGTFEMTDDGVVTGTVLASRIGDLRYLAGAVHGHKLQLSTFDGQHAYYVEAQIDERHARLEGTWFYPHLWTDPFIAKRVDKLDPSELDQIELKPGADRVTLAELDTPRYRGKPVVVDYFGTWCPACMDETPFLVELYKRYHPKGLEILSIALEGTTDEDYNRKQVERFKKRYGVPWEVEIVSSQLSELKDKLPPELEGTGGYPVTLFIRRDGTVRAVHSGFFSPAAGDDYKELKARFEGYVKELVKPRP